MINWKEFQSQVNNLFTSLGHNAHENYTVFGARGKHKIDVFVEFTTFGYKTTWAIECKYWNTSVTKEKVLVLQKIVDDIGADRGVLLSKKGFQIGAINAAEKSNITLTDFEELEKTIKKDQLVPGLQRLETKAASIKYDLLELYHTEKIGPNHWKSTLPPRLDHDTFSRTIADLDILEVGFNRVRLNKTPFPIKFAENGNDKIAVKSVERFVQEASTLIERAKLLLDSNSTTSS